MATKAVELSTSVTVIVPVTVLAAVWFTSVTEPEAVPPNKAISLIPVTVIVTFCVVLSLELTVKVSVAV